MPLPQVSTSESVDVDYLTPHLYSDLEIVATSNSTEGGVRLDRLILDFCLPCDFNTLHQHGQFTTGNLSNCTLAALALAQQKLRAVCVV